MCVTFAFPPFFPHLSLSLFLHFLNAQHFIVREISSSLLANFEALNVWQLQLPVACPLSTWAYILSHLIKQITRDTTTTATTTRGQFIIIIINIQPTTNNKRIVIVYGDMRQKATRNMTTKYKKEGKKKIVHIKIKIVAAINKWHDKGNACPKMLRLVVARLTASQLLCWLYYYYYYKRIYLWSRIPFNLNFFFYNVPNFCMFVCMFVCLTNFQKYCILLNWQVFLCKIFLSNIFSLFLFLGKSFSMS